MESFSAILRYKIPSEFHSGRADLEKFFDPSLHSLGEAGYQMSGGTENSENKKTLHKNQQLNINKIHYEQNLLKSFFIPLVLSARV
jgi:hypothetical protein